MRAWKHAIAALGCALAALSPQPGYSAPEQIPITTGGVRIQLDARGIADYRTAIAAIASVLVHELKLPVPAYTLEIYPTREEFEAGLIKHLGLEPVLARSTASFAQAAVGGQRVLVNEVQVAKLSWPERIELLAHELVHTVQLGLSDHHSINKQQWLTEGHAEWIAYAVTEKLGLDDLSRQRTRIIAALRSAGGTGKVPGLDEMDEFSQWISTRRKYGFTATFSLSFLIVDYLMKRHSHDALLSYFRQFGTSSDYPANFHAAFGESLPDFDVALKKHLAELLD